MLEALEDLKTIMLSEPKLKNKEIEQEVGLPKNSLSNFLTGKKELPTKFRVKLQSFVDSKKAVLQAKVFIDEAELEDLKKKLEAAEAENKALKKELEDIKSRPIKETANLGQKNASGVNVKNFNNQPKSDYSINTEKHPLWKEGDPKERSGAFMLRYGVETYEELEKTKK